MEINSKPNPKRRLPVIVLSENQRDFLDAECVKHGETMAVIVRRLISDAMDRKSQIMLYQQSA